MEIKATTIAYLIYILGNTVGLYSGLNRGGFETSTAFIEIKSQDFLIAYVLQFMCATSILFFEKIIRTKRSTRLSIKIGQDQISLYIIYIQLSYFIFSHLYGAGVAGDDISTGQMGIWGVIFALVQPDLLFMMTAPFIISNKLYLTSLSIFLISLTSRGWMGGYFISALITVIRFNSIKINLKSTKIILGSLILTAFALPFMTAMKWGFRLKMSTAEIFTQALDNLTIENYLLALEETISRFSHINYAALLSKESNIYYTAFINNEFRSFWQNSIFYTIICRISSSCQHDINSFIGNYSLALGNEKWNVDPGIAGWLFILKTYIPLFLIFLTITTVISFRIIARLYGGKGVQIASLFSLIYLYHGWINPYLNLILYMIIFGSFTLLKINQNVRN